MTAFKYWEHAGLVKFATEANEKMKEQAQDIETLKLQLKDALHAYRMLVVQNAKENDDIRFGKT